LTKQELEEIQNAIKEDGKIDGQEVDQIGKLMTMLKNGELEVE